MNRLRRFVAVIVAVCFFNVYAARPAHAVVDPLTPYLVASVVFHLGVFGIAVYKKLSGGGGSAASGTANGGAGGVSTAANVTWVDLSGPNGTPKVNSKNIVATVDMSTLKTTVDANGSQAPTLKTTFADKPVTATDSTGVVIQTSIGKFKLGNPVGTGAYEQYSTFSVTQDPSPGAGTYSRSAAPNIEDVQLLDGSYPFRTTFSGGLLSRFAYSTQYASSTYTNSHGYTVTTYYVARSRWNATTTSDPVTYSSNTSPFVPSEAATNINSDTTAQAEVPAMLAKVPKDKLKYLDTSDPSNFSAPVYSLPTPATSQQIADADMKEYKAQLSSLKASADAATAVATANPTPENLTDMNNWKNAYNTWAQGGTGTMTGGYPITSGSSTFPTYNGSASGPSTVQPPTPGTNTGGDAGGSTNGVVYNPQGLSSTPYGSGQTVGDFGGRITQFVNDVKATPIFSMPSSLLGNIPGGGSSTITFSAGRWGTHTYDFSSWGSILDTLKALILIIFSAVAVRIVTLKGGGA